MGPRRPARPSVSAESRWTAAVACRHRRARSRGPAPRRPRRRRRRWPDAGCAGAACRGGSLAHPAASRDRRRSPDAPPVTDPPAGRHAGHPRPVAAVGACTRCLREPAGATAATHTLTVARRIQARGHRCPHRVPDVCVCVSLLHLGAPTQPVGCADRTGRGAATSVWCHLLTVWCHAGGDDAEASAPGASRRWCGGCFANRAALPPESAMDLPCWRSSRARPATQRTDADACGARSAARAGARTGSAAGRAFTGPWSPTWMA